MAKKLTKKQKKEIKENFDSVKDYKKTVKSSNLTKKQKKKALKKPIKTISSGKLDKPEMKESTKNAVEAIYDLSKKDAVERDIPKVLDTSPEVNISELLLESLEPSTQLAADAAKQSSSFADTSKGMIDNLNTQAAIASDPRLSAYMSDFLDSQYQQSLSDLEDYYFQGDPAFKSKANMRAMDALFAGGFGTPGSTSHRRAKSEVLSNLQRDFNRAKMNLGDQYRQNQLGQIDSTRNTATNLAGTYAGTGSNFAGAANQGYGTAGGLQNQNFANRVGAINTGANLDQRNWDNAMNYWAQQNQARQQNLANMQGARANRKSQQMSNMLMDML